MDTVTAVPIETANPPPTAKVATVDRAVMTPDFMVSLPVSIKACALLTCSVSSR